MALRDNFIQQVACGFAYTAAVCNKGLVYTWGAGEVRRYNNETVTTTITTTVINIATTTTTTSSSKTTTMFYYYYYCCY